MSSKRDGNIQPSVRSQPPRFTARMGSPGATSVLLASDRGRSHQEQTRRRRSASRTRQRRWVSALVMVQMTTKLTMTLAYIYILRPSVPKKLLLRPYLKNLKFR
jgi:hypothetical protein